MAEHWIRLRGGWEWHGPDGSRRVTLPVVWPDGLSAPVRLVRTFNRPPVDDRTEAVHLHFESVPGLIAARLNDDPLPPGRGSWSVPCPAALPARNVLVLEVGPAAGPEERWGVIALIVQPRERPSSPDRA